MDNSNNRVREFAELVSRGEGFAPWQSRETVSAAERDFRAGVESRKDSMLAAAAPVRRPVLIRRRDLAQARKNIEKASWAREWFESRREIADYIVAQPDGYVERMIPEQTPWVGYTFICPHCFGIKSFEGTEYGIIGWDHRHPDTIRCTYCGHCYPSPDYPETAAMSCPRSGQIFSFYLNPREQKNPADRSGSLAWCWAHHPIHDSFSGVIRELKARFLLSHARTLAIVYGLTGDARYAERAGEILLRTAYCFRHTWLYHDYWDTVADCDPLYAAWHDHSLPLEWKRNLFWSAYEKDEPVRAAMLQGYWGAGRLHPSTGSVGTLPRICEAYDLIATARRTDGRPVLSAADRRTIEKDLILEWMIEAEPFVGGPGKAESVNNKSPRVYHAMAAVARSLGITDYAATALAGYEAIRDRSFEFDGFSKETPSYTEMYLHELLWIPERLNGFRWPQGSARTGRINLYMSDALLPVMLQATLDSLAPDGSILPIGDSHVTPPVGADTGGSHILEIGLARMPSYFAPRLRDLYSYRRMKPTEYAILHIDADYFSGERESSVVEDLRLPEILFPAWMTAILRHGAGMEASLASLAFNPAGGHRHYDNLALYYMDRGRTILGDHGYLAEAPAQEWIRHTFSHNLVIVDDDIQVFRSDAERRPSLRMMVTSPHVSAVEASSYAYTQCSDYRRLIVMIKGPGSDTFLVDVFRVAGGSRHDYRVFNELAASDAGAGGSLQFSGIAMPAEPPLPQIGASEKREDIFGLRDLRSVSRPAGPWQAVWRQPDRASRLWMLSRCDIAQASNGPGQEMWNNPAHIGRRVRYVDAVNQGANIASTFVAIHEPSDISGGFPVHRAARLDVPAAAGPNAVAVEIESVWGTYHIMSDFAAETEVAGTVFQGELGIFCRRPDGGTWMLSVGAATARTDGKGFARRPAVWSGAVEKCEGREIVTSAARPSPWPKTAGGVTPYVLVGGGERWTGYPVVSTSPGVIRAGRFNIRPEHQFRLPAVHWCEGR